VPSDDPAKNGCPLDSDDDPIPNTVTVTFTLPDCHFVDELGGTTDLTGSVVVSDPTVNTAGLSYRLALRSLRILLTDPDEGSLTFSRNGTGSVDHTAQELLQEQTFTTTVAAFGQSASFTTDWTALFRAATGSAIVVNGPLPDGTFAPSGSMSLTQGGERFAFTVETAETLVYSADCAEDLFGDNPFTDGTLRANITGAQGNAHVLIEFGANGACLEPRITYHGSNTAAID